MYSVLSFSLGSGAIQIVLLLKLLLFVIHPEENNCTTWLSSDETDKPIQYACRLKCGWKVLRSQSNRLYQNIAKNTIKTMTINVSNRRRGPQFSNERQTNTLKLRVKIVSHYVNIPAGVEGSQNHEMTRHTASATYNRCLPTPIRSIHESLSRRRCRNGFRCGCSFLAL